MSEPKTFTAPWGTLLWVFTGISTVVMLGLPLIFFFAAEGLPWLRWSMIAGLPLLYAALYLLAIKGYRLEGQALYVLRPLHRNAISLEGLTETLADPDLVKGSIRLWGNGGAFSFTGIWKNERLGKYRIFANDLKRSVLLRTKNGIWVVTPGDPDALVAALQPLLEE